MPQTPCPYCGHTTSKPDATRCDACNGLFEELSRKATQLAMGPWFIRDEARPFMPGFSVTILKQQVDAGKIKPGTIVRGPTTNQFWMRADKTPGLSSLLGKCHQCAGAVGKDDKTCPACSTDISLPGDIDRLGLSYVDPADREQAWQEVSTKRTAPPAAAASSAAAAPKPAPKPKPKAASSDIVDPDLMKPVAARSEPEPAPQPEYVDETPDASDIAEDLWHAPPSAAVRRRRRKKGADPLVVGLGVLLFCLVAATAIIVLTGGAGDKDDTDNADTASNDKKDNLKKRTGAEVLRVSAAAKDLHRRVGSLEMPPDIKAKYDAVTRMIAQADSDSNAEKTNEAFDAYTQAQAALAPLEQEIAAWRSGQENQDEANAVLARVGKVRSEATREEAGKWSPTAWSEAQASWDKADAELKNRQYNQAIEKLVEAEEMYQMSLGHARAAKSAVAARESLLTAMKAGPEEQALQQHAGQLIQQLRGHEAEAQRLMQVAKYDDAEQEYLEAKEVFERAVKAVELSKFRKLYAFNAGFNAAGLLLGIASGDGVDDKLHAELVKAYDQLALAENPAASIRPGADAQYTQAAAKLALGVREAIKQSHGEEVQACYAAGFQARIIDQTLKTIDLTTDQQKRIHQALAKLDEEATAAGWVVTRFSPKVDDVRSANRRQKPGGPPTATQAAWSKLIKQLQDQDYALRLMDPKMWPSTPEEDLKEPELFPDA